MYFIREWGGEKLPPEPDEGEPEGGWGGARGQQEPVLLDGAGNPDQDIQIQRRGAADRSSPSVTIIIHIISDNIHKSLHTRLFNT